MASLDGCPRCIGFKSIREYLCNECNGNNARASYAQRTGMFAANLRVAAVEELRVRAATDRVRDTWSLS